MHDTDTEHPSRPHRGDPAHSRSGTWLLVLLVIPVLYVLSTGPLVWLERNVGVGGLEPVLRGVYAPIRWLFEYEVPVAAPALQWYVELFID